ncbi:MAG: hypothetical protein R3Y24_06075 [Eubacteriales bacterium]
MIRKFKSVMMLLSMVLLLQGCAITEDIVEQTIDEVETTLEEAVTAETQESDSEQIDVKLEISMEEAIEIGATEAATYYDDLQLSAVYSYDGDELREEDAGVDGKRQLWYVNFANEESNLVHLLIKNGEIERVHTYDESGNYGLIDTSIITMTAQDAVDKSIELGLRGGNPDKPEEWVSGFNFNLVYGSLTEAPEEVQLFIEVIGISQNDNFAHVIFDAETSTLLLAEEKVVDENGDVIEWRELH